jgi:hypothetical protein
MGLAGFWLVFSLAGLVLSVMGMMKLGKTGGKKGLAIAGLVLGLVATLLSVSTVMGVSKAQTEFEKVGLGSKALETVGNAMEEGLKTAADSLKNAQ